MPVLTESATLVSSLPMGADVATQFPASAKRRIWVAPQVQTHAAVVLTATKLVLVPGSTPPPIELVNLVSNGADPSEVFGLLATVVNLESVRTIAHDLLENRIHLDSQAGGHHSSTWTSRSSVQFADSESADALFAKLWRRLGDDYKLRPDRPPVGKAVQAPLSILAGILLATGVLAAGANAAADIGRAVPGWLRPLQSIDWRLIAVLGGIVAALVQVWLYRILTRPPVRLELVKP